MQDPKKEVLNFLLNNRKTQIAALLHQYGDIPLLHDYDKGAVKEMQEAR